MSHVIEPTEEQLRARIKHVWHNLTDEEISYHAGLRDVFFLAVRKKYGLPRAQAEEILKCLTLAPYKRAEVA